MIYLRWIEDGELKSLDLHHNQAVRQELERIESLERATGQAVAYLQHPVTDALFPLHGNLYQVHFRTVFSESDEVVNLMKLARIIDSRDESQRASAYISHRLAMANYETRIAQLTAEAERLRAEVSSLEAQLGENRPQEAE